MELPPRWHAPRRERARSLYAERASRRVSQSCCVGVSRGRGLGCGTEGTGLPHHFEERLSLARKLVQQPAPELLVGAARATVASGAYTRPGHGAAAPV